MKYTRYIILYSVTATLAVVPLRAGQIMPSFWGAPAGWTTDRYNPASFTDIGNYQGQQDVLQIGIDTSGNLNNRPPAYQYSFYNTQGEGYNISGGVGDFISAALFIPSAWNDPVNNGNVRTDLWAVMTDGTANVTYYGIIGFTNYGGSPRLRVWDSAGSWIDLAPPVQYDQWTNLGVALTPTSIVYLLNGDPAATVTDIGSTTSFSRTMIEAYNFGDPSIAGATVKPYTAEWANGTPEPGTMGLVLGGAAMVLVGYRRRSARNGS